MTSDIRETPRPTREAADTEDRFTEIYKHGEFHAYLPKGVTLKAYSKEMKKLGYVNTGFTIGGAYMKVNFNHK